MKLNWLYALSVVCGSSPALAAPREEIVNRQDVPPGLPVKSLPGFDPNASTTASSLSVSSSGSPNNSTSSIITLEPPTTTSPSVGVTTLTVSDGVPGTSPTSISCVRTGRGAPKTIISTSYLETTTFYGDPSDYTPPFPTLTSIPFCADITASLPVPLPPAPSTTRGIPVPGYPGTTTFVTTDKNPKVVYKPSPPPDFSSPRNPGANDPGQHETARPGNPVGADPPEGDGPNNPKPKPSAQPEPKPKPKPKPTITAGPDKVIIGTSTIKGLKPEQTSTVVVDDETYTILPTAVVGGGGTIEKPAPADAKEWKASPTMDNIGGLPISASGSVIEVDGRTMTIPSEGTTTKIKGQDVSISPGEVKVGDDDFSWQATDIYGTDAIVARGQMVTAIGPTIFVVNETTLTYGPDISATEVTVDDDVITIAPQGVVVNNSTLGGPGAGKDETTYAVVGGMTITHIGSSLFVIDGHTYTVNEDSEEITTFVGGERMTIGPDGVEIGSMTIGLDDDNAVTGTLEPGDKTGDDGPEKTGNNDESEDDEDDMAGMLSPTSSLLVFALGIVAANFA